mmetsp:Transcript_5477/g.7513  ORF Transcript_5477/g.7513 Transcript_5477/m.7513 type:complete len:877 (+) Transcript_5477:90-2720(+)
MNGESLNELVELWEAPCAPQSLQWATDGSLGVARTNTITILTPGFHSDFSESCPSTEGKSGVTAEGKVKEKAFAYRQHHLTAPPVGFKKEVSLDEAVGNIWKESGTFESSRSSQLSHALRAERVKRQRLFNTKDDKVQVRALAWAPAGTALGCSCLLGVCFDDGRVLTFAPPCSSISLEWEPVDSVTLMLKNMVHGLKSTNSGVGTVAQTTSGRLELLDCMRLAWTRNLLVRYNPSSSKGKALPYALLAVTGRKMVSLWSFEPPSLPVTNGNSYFRLAPKNPVCCALLGESGASSSVTALEFSPHALHIDGQERLLLAVATFAGSLDLWALDIGECQSNGKTTKLLQKWRTVKHPTESSIDALCFCTSWTGNMKLVFTQGLGNIWMQEIPGVNSAQPCVNGKVALPICQKVAEDSGHLRPIVALCPGPRAPPSEDEENAPLLVISGSLDGVLRMWDLSDKNGSAVKVMELIEAGSSKWQQTMPIWGVAISPQSRTVAVLHYVGAELQNTRSNQSFVLKKHNHASVSVLNLIGPEDLVNISLENEFPPWDWVGAVNAVISDFVSTGESFSKLNAHLPGEDSFYSKQGILKAIASRFLSVVNTIPGVSCLQDDIEEEESEIPRLQLEFSDKISDQALRLLHLTCCLLPDILVDGPSMQKLKKTLFCRFLFPELRRNYTQINFSFSSWKYHNDASSASKAGSSKGKGVQQFSQKLRRWLHSNSSFVTEQFILHSQTVPSSLEDIFDSSQNNLDHKTVNEQHLQPTSVSNICPICSHPVIISELNSPKTKGNFKESSPHIDKCLNGHSIQCCGRCLEYSSVLILSYGCCHICKEIYHTQISSSVELNQIQSSSQHCNSDCFRLFENDFQCLYCSIPLELI